METVENNSGSNLEFLDILAIVSFVIQMQNQNKIFSISDVQKELHKAVSEIHAHLEIQDDKIDRILEVLDNDQNKKIRRAD